MPATRRGDSLARRHAVQVSDPARTLLDLLTSPGLGGGIRHVAEMLTTLLRHRPDEAPKLLLYAEKLGVGAVYKRLGYLLQRDHTDAGELIDACRQRMTAGYANLDPALPADRLVTAWRVWVPDSEMREPAS
jgi:predicted transcriptional regulator of viral defense system